MLIALSKLKVRNGHMQKVISLLQENQKIGTGKEGCISGYNATGIEDTNIVLVCSHWKTKSAYDEASKEIKKDSRTKKMALQILPHLSEEPKVETFIVI